MGTKSIPLKFRINKIGFGCFILTFAPTNTMNDVEGTNQAAGIGVCR